MDNAILSPLGPEPQPKQSGFTLIELAVAMLIAFVVSFGAYRAYENQVRTNNTQRAVVELHQNVRSAMYYLTRDIRMAGYDPKNGLAGAGFVTADASTISFTWDITGGEADGEDSDGDGTIDNNETYDGRLADPPDFEGVTYTLVGTEIQRDGVAVAENINALNFTYLDENDAVLPTPVQNMKNIRKVRISITGAAAAGGLTQDSGINRTMQLTSDVKVRNIVLH